MSYRKVEESGFSFYVDESIFEYDDYEHWLELVRWAINKLDKQLDEIEKKYFNEWVIFHRRYSDNHKLDFNYALFDSSHAKFEVVRDYSRQRGYSEPIITNVTEKTTD